MDQAAARTSRDRSIGLHLRDGSLAPRVLFALRALGYRLVDCEVELEDDARIRLVDADRIASVPAADEAPDLRLLVIGATERIAIEDERIVASTQRPGRLGPVYGMLQIAMENTPRRCPRVATRLSARCIRADRRSIGALLSLSEGGCLLRTREALQSGARLSVQFALPQYGLVSTRAECRYVRGDHAGLAFSDPTPDVQRTIAHFVTCELSSLYRGGGAARAQAG